MNLRTWLGMACRVWREQGPLTLLSCAYRERRRRRGDVGVRERAWMEYLAWARDQQKEMTQRRQPLADRLTHRPLVSAIVAAQPRRRTQLRDSLASLGRQSYDHTELLFVTEVARASALPGRVLPSVAEAVAAAKGDWVLLLDPGDRLAPDLLLEAVAVLNNSPETDIVYWDEDRLTRLGKVRHAPWFKPDWSPELLLSVNYLAPALIRRRLALEAIEAGADLRRGATWDFSLHCAERARRIEHLPRVLLHRASPAPASEEDAAAVAGHLARRGVRDASASVSPDGLVRVAWPASGRLVSIIIPTRENVHLLGRCLESIFAKTQYSNYEIVLVDNGSREEATLRLYERLRDNPRVRIVDYCEPFNFSRANNLGARHARGDLLLFLNNDTEVLDAEWLTELVRWAERPEVGVVGGQLFFPDGTIQHAGVIIGLGGIGDHIWRGEPPHRRDAFGSSDWYRNCLAVTGACQMIRREVFEELGGFDEGYILVFSDVEICLRAHQRGYRSVYTPFAILRHHEGKTRGNLHKVPPGDCVRAAEQMGDWVARGDPYFHELLSWISCTPMLPPDPEPSRMERLSISLRAVAAAQPREAA